MKTEWKRCPTCEGWDHRTERISEKIDAMGDVIVSVRTLVAEFDSVEDKGLLEKIKAYVGELFVLRIITRKMK